jgi:hypothetical protein
MKYLKIADHYDECFKKHGATHLGVDWPNHKDVLTRYNIMYDLMSINNETNIPNSTLLDFGCGFAGFMGWMESENKDIPIYSGLDINKSFCDYCSTKYKNLDFFNLDVLVDDNIPNFDYIICNGTFTEKRELSHEEMMGFFKSVIIKLWDKTQKGIAFNLMSKIVDWEREDLFHVSFDELAWFLKNTISKDFIIRNDYKLYEYTVYVYKK